MWDSITWGTRIFGSHAFSFFFYMHTCPAKSFCLREKWFESYICDSNIISHLIPDPWDHQFGFGVCGMEMMMIVFAADLPCIHFHFGFIQISKIIFGYKFCCQLHMIFLYGLKSNQVNKFNYSTALLRIMKSIWVSHWIRPFLLPK